MSEKISVAILEDHQSVIDGYIHRLGQNPEIEIVGAANFGSELEILVTNHQVDVLLLDIKVPTSPENLKPYPILYEIPKLLQRYPNLKILVITMHNQSALIKSVMDAGASGYVLKDDIATIHQLDDVIITVAKGGVHLSQHAYQQLFKKMPKENIPTPRQMEVLSLCVTYPDATSEELAKHLHVTQSTVRNLLSGVYIRLDVRSRAGAIIKARQLGLIPPIEDKIEF
ncbi:MAG: response regulator transcription factor [Chloroflexi bacterium]|nr:response regulator transcription factor [Chloroflexota bacterium]